jgi:cytochrome c oxidase subunit 2
MGRPRPAIAASTVLPVVALSEPYGIPWTPLFIFIMVVAVVIVLLVAGVLAYIVARFRAQPGAGVPRQDFGNRRLEIGWTVAPALLVSSVFALTVYVMSSTPTPGAGIPEGSQPDIEVIGHQWWWEIRYPQAGVVTANVMHLPVGRPLLVTLHSDDVQHDFWVPELGQKMDMYPGRTNHIWLEAREPGFYQGACAEFCGMQHAWMRILAVAQPQAEFDAWLAAQRAVPAPLVAPLAQQGQFVFQGRTCGSCHAIAGTPFTGQAGPNLTRFGSRPTISAGVLVNTPENLARYLRDPQAVKPGIFMPNFRLTEEEIAALVAYLGSLQ